MRANAKQAVSHTTDPSKRLWKRGWGRGLQEAQHFNLACNDRCVAYLHSLGVIHRDLKPENILMKSADDDTSFVLADFGFAKHSDEASAERTLMGTADYVAPEVLSRREYSPAVDVWALGVIIYILLAGYPPFFDDSDEKLFAKIQVSTAGTLIPFCLLPQARCQTCN